MCDPRYLRTPRALSFDFYFYFSYSEIAHLKTLLIKLSAERGQSCRHNVFTVRRTVLPFLISAHFQVHAQSLTPETGQYMQRPEFSQYDDCLGIVRLSNFQKSRSLECNQCGPVTGGDTVLAITTFRSTTMTSQATVPRLFNSIDKCCYRNGSLMLRELHLDVHRNSPKAEVA
jgi:hypothetical protein